VDTGFLMRPSGLIRRSDWDSGSYERHRSALIADAIAFPSGRSLPGSTTATAALMAPTLRALGCTSGAEMSGGVGLPNPCIRAASYRFWSRAFLGSMPLTLRRSASANGGLTGGLRLLGSKHWPSPPTARGALRDPRNFEPDRSVASSKSHSRMACLGADV
jgi:hypothetical protein